jgi:hypothetical protein
MIDNINQANTEESLSQQEYQEMLERRKRQTVVRRRRAPGTFDNRYDALLDTGIANEYPHQLVGGCKEYFKKLFKFFI